MRAVKIAERRENAMKNAMEMVRLGSTLRKAAEVHRVPRATLHDRIKKKEKRPSNWCRTILTKEEEEVIVGTLLRYSTRGVPLTRSHLVEAVAIQVERMSPDRRAKLPFTNGVPGIRFIRNFEKRHKDRVRFGFPTKQEAKRYAAANADYLTSHFATLKRLIEVHNFDEQRIWNLDETGSSPEKEQFGRGRRRRYVGRGTSADMRVAEFLNANRVTILPCISASGDMAPPMFVFKGKQLPFRNVVRAGEVVSETYHDHLPARAVVAMREELGGVDSSNFLAWARSFVEHVQYLVRGGRPILLIYDAYRSHMSLAVLELLLQNNIVVYALPAHTSGKTQPLDVVLFGIFKLTLRDLLVTLLSAEDYTKYNMYDFCRLPRHAYHEAFSRANIRAGFKRAGIWPFRPVALLGNPRPASVDDLNRFLTVEEMAVLFEKKLSEKREEVFGEKLVMTKNGFIDTSGGAVLTSERAMVLVRKKNLQMEQKKVAAAASALKAQERALDARQKSRAEAKMYWAVRNRARATLMGLTVENYLKRTSSIKERRIRQKTLIMTKRLAENGQSTSGIARIEV